jgi:hypothetical protein
MRYLHPARAPMIDPRGDVASEHQPKGNEPLVLGAFV